VSLLLAFIAGGVFVLAIATPIAVVVYRNLERLREIQNATLNSALVHRDEQLEAAQLRLVELDRQIDSLRAEGYIRSKPEPVVELPAEEELPAEIEKVLEGFEDADDIEDFREAAKFMRRNRPRRAARELANDLLAEA
jgi:hypothetical protein